MPFFKAARDQLKANAFISDLEFAKSKFRPNDVTAAALHVKWAFEAVQKLREAEAGYVISRDGWLYASELCLELSTSLSSVGEYRLSGISFFMYQWTLWNEGRVTGRQRDTREPEFTADTPERRLRNALEFKSKELDLSELEMTQLPESLRDMVFVESLVLSRNRLTCLPTWIGELASLRALDLSGNQISHLPASMASLANLQELSICDTRLTMLPDVLVTLPSLRELYVYSNRLTHLPDSIGNLKFLRKLSAGNNQLERLPDSIGDLTSLEELYLEKNLFRDLPISLQRLSCLNILDVSGNPLTGSAEDYGEIGKLIQGQF